MIKAVRQRVLDAAITELAVRNVGSFTMEGVASRAGVDVLSVKVVWANTPQLLSAALGAYARQYLPIPDTGTLRGDLLQYAKTWAESFNSPVGRRVLHTVIATPNDWDVRGWRWEFLDGRQRRIGRLLDRAVQRGECPPDTDPARVVDLLVGALGVFPLLYDRAITDEDCEYVVQTLLNGILRTH